MRRGIRKIGGTLATIITITITITITTTTNLNKCLSTPIIPLGLHLKDKKFASKSDNFDKSLVLVVVVIVMVVVVGIVFFEIPGPQKGEKGGERGYYLTLSKPFLLPPLL